MLASEINDNKRAKRNIVIFCAYRFLSRFYMYLPILAILLYKHNLSYVFISYVLAIHGISIMIYKAPLEFLVKKFKYQKTVVLIGEIIKTIGILTLALSQGDLYYLLLGQMLSGMGFALTSSVESSLLFNSMKEGKQEDRYREIEAKSQSFSFVSILISGVIGSIIAAINTSYPLFLSAPFSLISGILILLFRETPSIVAPEKSVDTRTKQKNQIQKDIKSTSHYLTYYAFNRALILLIFVFVLPLYLFNEFNVNLALMGTILGLFSFSSYIIANKLEKVTKFIGKEIIWIVPPVVLLYAILFMVIKNIAFLVAIPVFFGIAVAIVRPLAMGRINEMISDNRSIVMSRGEQLFGFLNGAFLIAAGYTLFYYGIDVVLYLLLLISVIGNISLVFVFKNKEKNEEEVTKEDVIKGSKKDIKKEMNK